MIYTSMRTYRQSILLGETGASCTRVSCNRGLADKTVNANYSARREHVYQ